MVIASANVVCWRFEFEIQAKWVRIQISRADLILSKHAMAFESVFYSNAPGAYLNQSTQLNFMCAQLSVIIWAAPDRLRWGNASKPNTEWIRFCMTMIASHKTCIFFKCKTWVVRCLRWKRIACSLLDLMFQDVSDCDACNKSDWVYLCVCLNKFLEEVVRGWVISAAKDTFALNATKAVGIINKSVFVYCSVIRHRQTYLLILFVCFS